MIVQKQELADSILKNLSNSDVDMQRWDDLQPTDPDYMMYSPLPVGYNSISEQRFLMQNLLVGFSGGSLLDIGCGRCDLYGVAQEFALLNNDIVAYNGIDHNPIMTQLGEKKWGLTNVSVGAFETAKLQPHEWVVASGIFTERRCETENEDLIKLINNVDILYNMATQIVSFNLLNPINTKHHQGFFYVHPGLILDMLIEKYRYVNLRNNYSPDVYTITIYKY
jgi:SAM-dependent methyltransferase